eukprot:969085-Pyramimonas_sp.AAC.1
MSLLACASKGRHSATPTKDQRASFVPMSGALLYIYICRPAGARRLFRPPIAQPPHHAAQL